MNKEILEENIYYYTDALKDPQKILELIEEMDSVPESYATIMKWSTWNASNDQEFIYGSSKIILWERESVTSNLDADIKSNYIISSIRKAYVDVANDFKNSKNISENILLDNVIGIKRYNVSTSMGQHADSYDGNTRLKYSMVLYYNDDYEGGEISFPNQNITIKPKAGSIIIFPSTEPYIHESLKIISGSKYMTASFWLHEQGV